MVGYGIVISAIGNPASIRSNARHGGGLATFTWWPIVDMVVISYIAAWPTVASGNCGHHKPREEIKSHWEDSGSHGAEAIDRGSCHFRGNDYFLQYMPWRGWFNGYHGLVGPVKEETKKKYRRTRISFRGYTFRFWFRYEMAIRWGFHSMYKVLGE